MLFDEHFFKGETMIEYPQISVEKFIEYRVNVIIGENLHPRFMA
jgi:hypothetical protein